MMFDGTPSHEWDSKRRMVEAARYIKTLTGSADTPVTFQTFDDTERKAGALAKIIHGTLAQCWERLDALNAQGAGIFVTVNETDLKGRKDSNITRARATFADFDPPETNPAPDTWTLAPSMLVASSPGKVHAYWLADDVALGEFQPLQKAIIAKLGSDKSVHDLPRVMRVPGFFHCKGEPVMVRLVSTNPERRYSAGAIVEAFKPDDPIPAPTNDTRATVREPEHNDLGDLCTSAGSRWDQVKRAAMANLGAWVPVLFPNARAYHDGFRVSSAELGRELEEDLSIVPTGIKDFGVHDQGDPNAGKRTVIDLVMEHRKCSNVEAAIWLCERLGIDPAELGFKAPSQEGQEDEAPPLRVVDLADVLTADISGPEFIVDRLIPRGHATLFGGHGESGKTYIALALGVHVALGVPWAGLATRRGRVLFVSLEDDGEIMRYRLRRVIEGHMMQAHFHNIAANLRIIDGHDSGPMVTEFADAGVRRIMPTKVYESVKSEVEQFKPDLLIIDNASDAFDGDENNRRQVRQFIKRLVALGKEQDTAVILLAHISKGAAQYGSAGNSYSGSTQWHNSVRSRIAIIDSKLVHEKSNHGAKLDCEIPLVWQNGCWKPDRNGEIQAEQRARVNETDDGHVYAAIAAVIWQGGEVRAADSGPYTTWHAISGRAELPDDLRADTREAKRRVKEAAHRLADAGRIRKEEFIASGRNKSYRWVLVEPGSVA